MSYDPPSILKLDQVSPVLRRRVLNAMDALATKGLYFRVAQGYRTYDEQEQLYLLGRKILRTPQGLKQGIVTWAHGGYSNHNFGLAVDCYPFLKGQTGALEMNDHTVPQFVAMVAALKATGLAWGGDWTAERDDYPHFYLENTPATPTGTDRLAFSTGGVQKVWEHYGVAQ